MGADPHAIPRACENGAAAAAVEQTALPRRPKPRRTYTRHGLNALKARVMVRGLSAIDRRTAAAQHLLGWRRELLEDMGGEAAVSAAQLALVEVATRTRLYLDHCDAALMGRESLVVRGRRLLPLVGERQKLADGLLRTLQALGLERRAKPAPSLAEWVGAARAQAAEASTKGAG